jgi:large subunit ribosomal protein L29
MSFVFFEELKKLDNAELNDALISAKTELFNLRLKKATRQSIKPHLFKTNRRKIAQLLTIKSERNLTN